MFMGEYLDYTIVVGRPTSFPRKAGGPELWKKRKVTEVNVWIAFSS